jgi:hypothetical protein
LQQDSYWEELFMKGSSAGPDSDAMAEQQAAAVGVEVVSFDLDDTLWCGKTVIANANKCVPRE